MSLLSPSHVSFSQSVSQSASLSVITVVWGCNRVSSTRPFEVTDPDKERLTVLYAHPMGMSQHSKSAPNGAGYLSRALDADVLYFEWPGTSLTTTEFPPHLFDTA